MGSGKDSIAALLVERYGFTKVAFAAALKDVCAVVFGWDREMLEGATDEARAARNKVDSWWDERLDLGCAVTPRSMLQYLGTELFRHHLDNDIWTNALLKRIQDIPAERIVITDARFFNELTGIHRLRSTSPSNPTQVVQLSISRKPASWWGKFYEAVDRDFKEEFNGRSFKRYNVMEHTSARLKLIELGKKHAPMGLHWSEVEFLLWPHYTAHLDNSGKLEDTLKQVYPTVAL